LRERQDILGRSLSSAFVAPRGKGRNANPPTASNGLRPKDDGGEVNGLVAIASHDGGEKLWLSIYPFGSEYCAGYLNDENRTASGDLLAAKARYA
jgi:hypothetical protein